MCRMQIPTDYFDHPVLIQKPSLEDLEMNTAKYQWYYEGQNGEKITSCSTLYLFCQRSNVIIFLRLVEV